jgi:hypothetical protein
MRQVGQIMAGMLGVRAALAEPCDGAPNDAGIRSTRVAVAESSLLHGAWFGVLHDHIDGGGQAPQYLRRRRIAQVERH